MSKPATQLPIFVGYHGAIDLCTPERHYRRMALHCKLLVPDLLWREGINARRDAKLAALTPLLARGNSANAAGATLESWLCREFGVARQQDWPVAPLTLKLDGGNPERDYWLRADPVHFILHRDHIVLADSRAFTISQPEAMQFTEMFNRHFQGDGLIFYPLHPTRWYLRVANSPGMTTSSLSAATGENIHPHLPQGSEAVRWKGIINEIQMLLHHHPENEAREARGDLPINSVWLWGGGTMPKVATRPYRQVWADDALAQALARESGAPASALPQDGEQWLASASDGKHLVVLDALRGPSQYGDTNGYREKLEELERCWFAPLKTALRQKRLAGLELTALDENAAHHVTVNRRDLWKLWRRSHPLHPQRSSP